ncbi:ANTAR domain-containing protein [Streptomyces apricus]|uniref:ANTAR domain-containing protein n=2 Tax=Streptomyces apricus TaxID=1828112 RepID=A0A5A9ZVT3_9ACTN|nr:ANTAR domain-containing protein [Streptomyces apricus]
MARILRDLPAGDGSDLLGGDPALCARVLGVDGIAVSLCGDDALTELVWSTPGRSADLEDAQYTLGEGPALDACRHRSLIALPDLQRTDPHRWPAFLPEAERFGVRALFCFPLHLGAVCLGVFTAQRATPAPLDAAQMNDAFILSAAITAALIRDDAQRQSFVWAEPSTTLHRAVVHQATGIISVQADVSLAQAMVLLRAHAYRTEKPLLETAEEVVARRLHFRDDKGGTTVPSSDKD